MKRKISIILVVILLISINLTYAVRENIFTDVKSTDWYNDTVTKLENIGSISGYPDGSFRPDNSMTKAEFVKTLVSSLGFNDLAKTGSHWASGYISQGEVINIIDKGWLTNIDKPISRYEMARIISNTLTYKNEAIPTDIAKYEPLISDFTTIPSSYLGETNGKQLSECVLESYVKGIVTGYPDGSFEGGLTLTRAEASTVIIRVLYNSTRITPVLKEIESMEQGVLRLVNIERNKAGLKSLVTSSELSKVALLKSKDMALFGYFDHISPNYGTPFEMMTNQGISYTAAGENIAKGYKTPEEVVSAWMNSPGHKANILSPQFNKMGLGIYVDESTYWTQMFMK